MNCQAVQRCLLGAARPARPPAAVQAHLAECAACRAWQGRLVELEARVPLLPVPASQVKGVFLRQFLDANAAHRPARAGGWRLRERAYRKLALASALAASLVLFALGWAVWQSFRAPAPTPRAPAAESVLEKLEKASLLPKAEQAPRERVETLAYSADYLFKQARQGPADGAKLDDLARQYEKVVRELLPQDAKALADDERAEVLKRIAARLDEAESEALRLAEQAAPEAEKSWRAIAAAAKDGRRQLLALV